MPDLQEDKEKSSLRRLLLQKRDTISADYISIASKQIQKNLKKIEAYRVAKKIAGYYSIGSEVRTGSIIQEILADGKTVALPRVVEDKIVFCEVRSFDELEKGEFGIMEPKLSCPITNNFDIILVPAIAMTKEGQRLGYGMGYYDRFLANTTATTIALAYSKLLVKSIPRSNHDITIQWIVTEDDVINTS